MENTNITDNTRQAGHSVDSTINAGTDIKSSTTNTSQHTIDDINSGQQPLEAESTLRLSDMYEKNVDNPELELTVRVININTDNYAGNKARTINSKYSNGSGRNSRIIIISTGQICIHIALNFFLNVRHLRTI